MRFPGSSKYLRGPLFVACVALAAGGTPLQGQDFYLHSGDRVAFYGDSITAQRFYTRDVQDFVATRYPTLDVAYENAGVPGDKVSGGFAGDAATRVARDVQPFHPTVITVMLGMNDGDYTPPDPTIFAAYQDGYRKLLDLLRTAAPGARITLLENTPYDEITHGTQFAGYMATTEQNARATPALARSEGLPYVDVYDPVEYLLEQAKTADPSLATMLVPERIHPSEPLHWVMAEAVMKAWHINPVVSEVAIDSTNSSVTESERTQVSGVSNLHHRLSWDQLDQALPLPFNLDNPLMNFVLRVSDLANWDQEVLRVNGLSAGEYELSIDGKAAGRFSSSQLGTGVNLALLETPMWQQARDYDDALAQRSSLEDAAFILMAETHVPDAAQGESVLRAGEKEFDQKAGTVLTLKPHHYVLSRVANTLAGKTP